MKMSFIHNNQEIININDIMRREVTKLLEQTELETRDKYFAIEQLGSRLKEMYEISHPSFDIYVGTMLSTTYMMLVNQSKNNTMNEENLMTFNVIKNFISEPSEVIDYISSMSGVFEDMATYTVLFEKLNILGRKKVVQNSKEYQSEITQIFPLSIFDFLRYQTPTTTKDFIQYYVETLDLIVTNPDILVNDIKFHMKHLYLYDREAYLKNLKEMAIVFYKWVKYQKSIDEIENEELIECLKMIENNDEDKLCELSILDDRILFNIISEFCYHSTSSGIRIKQKFISEESVDEYIKDKIPESLKENKQKKK